MRLAVMAQKYWQHYEHTADVGIRGIAPTLPDAFAQAALALTAAITDLEKIVPAEMVEITVQDDDPEVLFIDWLNALLYEMATRQMLFSRFDLRLEGDILTAKARGERIDIARHQPTVEVKAATYGDLKVEKRNNLWLAQCIIDV